ncbi:hypothetical protein FD754_018202 [Muntiacus muntjak]|uniref:INTS6/SAGE1/DDX26B/CT45 C-terminal domain-containing protein n=1 Tax=Muntiacus muntjak TaxID=9888 RepID=A0A5N3UWQ7_MUNMU|nr:hypothetical protein FD754_018202 [Muntiacus muntjak]
MTDEPEEFAVEPKKQKKHHGEPRSPFKRSSVALLSMKQERDGESHLGASSVSMEDDDQKAIAMSPLGMMPPKPPSGPEETNFGRKYEKIFKLLKEVQRPPEVRKQLVEFAIKEAARFKRGHLIKHLEIILEKIDSDHFLNKDTCIPNIYGHDQ